MEAVKRLLDFVLAAAGLAILLPIWPFLALAIKLDSKGPVLYRQERVGRNKKPYSMIKLRSMDVDAESGTPIWAEEHDSRTTRVGRILRRFHLDELPQLWNVVRGDMSLVGPRPERPEFVGELERRVPHYADRFAVRPGLTGWAQVGFKYTASFDDSRIKLEYDLHYISRWSLCLDLRILARTPGVVLRGDLPQ